MGVVGERGREGRRGCRAEEEKRGGLMRVEKEEAAAAEEEEEEGGEWMMDGRWVVDGAELKRSRQWAWLAKGGEKAEEGAGRRRRKEAD